MQIVIEKIDGEYDAIEAVRLTTESEDDEDPERRDGINVHMSGDDLPLFFLYGELRRVWIDGRADTQPAAFINEMIDSTL